MLEEDTYPVPRALLDQFNRALSEQNLAAEWGSLRVDRRGCLIAEEVVLSKASTDERLVVFDRMFIEFDVLYALAGTLQVDRILAQRGALICPAILSPSGVAEEAIREISIAIESEGAGWTINGLTARTAQAELRLSGDLPIISNSDVVLDIPGIIGRFSQSVMENQRWLTPFENPVVTLVNETKARDSAAFSILVEAKHFRPRSWLAINGMEMDDVSIHLDGSWTTERGLRFEKPVRIGSERAKMYLPESLADEHDLPRDIVIEQFSVVADWMGFPVQLAQAPRRVYVHANAVRAVDRVWENISMRAFIPKLPWISFQGELRLGGHPIAMQGGVKADDFAANLRVQSQAFVGDLVSLPGINKTGLGDAFDFTTTSDLRAEVELLPGPRLGPVTFSIDTGPVSLSDVPMRNVNAAGSVSPSGVAIDHLVMVQNDYRMTGSYQEDWNNDYFRLKVRGPIFPGDFNPMMPRWWEDLWADFVFNGRLPEVDLDIYGILSTRNTEFLFSSVTTWDTVINGLELDTVNGLLQYQPGIATIYALEATRPEGMASGALQWVLTEDEDLINNIDLWSNLDFAATAPFLGEDLAVFAEDIAFSTPPALKIDGRVVSLDSGETDRFIRFSAATGDSFTYQSVDFNWGRGSGVLQGQKLHLSPLQLGFGEGEIEAEIAVDGTDGRIAFDSQLRRASLKLTMQELANVLGEDGPAVPENASGVADGRIVGAGRLGDFETFRGQGQLRISDGDFGDVHMLGGLSKILSRSGFGFTSVTFDTLRTQVAFEDMRFDFSSLELSGETGTLQSEGSMDLRTGAIDFRSKLLMRKRDRNILDSIVNPITKPVSGVVGQALEMKVYGTSADPKWRLLIDPRNLFFGVPELSRERQENPTEAGASSSSEFTPGEGPAEPRIHSFLANRRLKNALRPLSRSVPPAMPPFTRPIIGLAQKETQPPE